MNDTLKRLEYKIDKIVDVQVKQEVNLGKLTISVEEHVKRSNLQEENMSILRQEVEPIKQHVAMVTGVLKFLGILSMIAAIVEAYFMVKK